MEAYARERSQTQVMVNTFISSVYMWMTAGLALTGFTAFFVASSPTLLSIVAPMRWVLLIAELGLVFFLVSRVHKMSASTATGMFLFFSALNGTTLSVLFLVYTAGSLASTFFICAATFGACSVYGMTTKRDLTTMGNFMFMGLIGIIIASVVNIFIQSSAIMWIVSYLGVFIFIGLTAYDTQKIKEMAMTQPADLDGGTVRKGAIMGALSLYLDFINMFLFMLHIFGGGD